MLDYNNNVFINCPFDDTYKQLFDAIVFTVYDCGFISRCTLEEQDGTVVRIERIYSIIRNCRYGIHDISRIETDENTKLPRFNMPLELGVFLGAKKFGIEEQKKKSCLILDTEEYRYQKFISDISGQDIRAHKNSCAEIVKVVRNWLRDTSDRTTIPSGSIIWEHYNDFLNDLPKMTQECNLTVDELIYNDYTQMVTEWLKTK